MSADQSVLPAVDASYDGAPCALLVTDSAGLILRANRTFCQWLGYSPDRLVGRRKLQELLTVGGRIFHQTHWLPLLELQRSIAEIKLDFKTASGEVLTMVLNAVRRQHAGGTFDEVSAFVIADRHRFEQELLIAKRQAEQALQDQISAQRDLSVADARLRVALETAQLYVWDVDPQTMERRYDNSVAHLLGFSSAQPVVAVAYLSFIDGEDREREAALFERALQLPGSEYRCVYRLNGADLLQRTVLSTGRGVFDPAGRLIQFVGVLHDVTEITRQRVLAEDRALFAEQMMGIVSHDLRNPLQVISMASQRLGREPLSATNATLLEHVRDATQRAQRLINDLLDFTQARIGLGLVVQKKPIDLRQTVESTVASLRLVHPERRIIFACHGDAACYADADRLAQLVGNLISNAIAYGDKYSAVTVTTWSRREGFEVAVHNFGPPIPDDLLGSVFEPMTRATEVGRTTRSVGLGLFIVSEIAKAHGGFVAVTSTAIGGTTFTVTFATELAFLT